MYEAFSYFYTSIASLLIASTVNPAEPKAPAINFGQIQPALSFGVSCKAALQTLDHLGLTYHQQAERDWIVITSGHMLGHPLNQADDSSLGGAETSKLWCSQATGIYRVELSWAGARSHSLYPNIVEAITQKLQLAPNSKKVRRRGARACSTWPATKTGTPESTIQVCQAEAFTRLDARNPKLEKAAKAAKVLSEIDK